MESYTEKEKIAHLLRRFGFGASEAEMDYYSPSGLSGAIDMLLDWESVQKPDFPTPDELDGKGIGANPRFAQVQWYGWVLVTTRPLEEKLTIFWHDHFATSAQKVDSGVSMYKHINTLRDNAGGKFQDLLTAVSKDPAMLYWLDNQENVKGTPNENFAREIMELFTLGLGHYTEHDIVEAARAFTGWTFGIQRGRRIVPLRNQLPRREVVFYFDEASHDNEPKTVFGKTGNWDGDDIIGMLCANPQTAKFITNKMWEFFAYENPEKGLIEKLAQKYIASGLDTKALVRAIMESPEFYSESCMRRLIKNPIDFCVVTARQLGLGSMMLDGMNRASEAPQKLRSFGPVREIATSTEKMGMELMYPPDVSGWEGGKAWITTATAVERVRWADVVMPTQGLYARRMFGILSDDPSPAGIVKRILSIFDVSMPDEKVKILEEAASETLGGRSLSVLNSGEVSNAVCRLVFGSPEFQMA